MPWRYVIKDFNGEEIVETFCKKLQNKSKKVIKK